jgi:hypothetical protein
MSRRGLPLTEASAQEKRVDRLATNGSDEPFTKRVARDVEIVQIH